MIFGQHGSISKHSFLVAGTPRKISGPRARDVMSLLEMQLVLIDEKAEEKAAEKAKSEAKMEAKAQKKKEALLKSLRDEDE